MDNGANNTIALCKLVIVASLAAVSAGAWTHAINTPSEVGIAPSGVVPAAAVLPGPAVAISAAKGIDDVDMDVTVDVDSLQEAELVAAFVVSDELSFTEDLDHVAEISAADMQRFNPPAAPAKERFAVAYQRLTSGSELNPTTAIEDLWAVSVDLDRQGAAINALLPYIGHADAAVSDKAQEAIDSLTASTQQSMDDFAVDDLALVDAETQVYKLYSAALAGTDPHSRGEAIGELGTYATADAVRAVEQVLYQEAAPEVRIRAVEALGNMATMDVDQHYIRQILEVVSASASPEVAAVARAAVADLPADDS